MLTGYTGCKACRSVERSRLDTAAYWRDHRPRCWASPCIRDAVRSGVTDVWLFCWCRRRRARLINYTVIHPMLTGFAMRFLKRIVLPLSKPNSCLLFVPLSQLCYRFSQIDGFGFFSLQSLIINSDGQSAAGYNCAFSNLAGWRFCFLGQPQRTMERISSALHFLGSDSGDRD
jgi:hypothetical protein